MDVDIKKKQSNNVIAKLLINVENGIKRIPLKLNQMDPLILIICVHIPLVVQMKEDLLENVGID